MRMRTVALLLTAVVLAACGTRLPDSEFATEGAVELDEGSEVAGSDGSDAESTDGGSTGTATGGTDGGDATGGGATGGTGGTGGGATGGGDGGGPSGPNQASDVGITPTSITLGNITAENGVLGDAFAPAARGLRAWVQHTNANGGIGGREIILKTCDDREDRARALACARQLVERDEVFALVGVNTRAIGGAAQYLNDQGVPVLGFPITNSFARYPHFWSTYPNGYPRDGQTVGNNGELMWTTGNYRWFREELGLDTAAVFSYDIDESRQAGAAFAEGLELEGFNVTSYSVSFAAPSFDQAVADMERRGVQIIMDSMDDGANRKLCDAMARRRFTVEAKVSTVVSFGDSVGNDYNDTCRNSVFIPGQSVPYTATNVPEVAEFRDAYSRYQPGLEVHQWALESWAQANTVAEAITGMGPAPTREGLEDFFRGMRSYTAGGIFVGLQWVPNDYNQPCFSIARWLDSEGGWVTATSDFPFCYPEVRQYSTPALEDGD